MSRSTPVVVLSLASFVLGAPVAMARTGCDRSCLRTTLDGYLDAVVANDPDAAPLVVGFRQTESAVRPPISGRSRKAMRRPS